MPEAGDDHHAGRRRRLHGRRRASRANATIRLVPKAERTRSSDEIARALNRQLAGVIPGVIIQTQASGGNQQMNRLLGGGDSRLSLEIRGDDLDEAKRLVARARRR